MKIGQHVRHCVWPNGVYGVVKTITSNRYVLLNVPFETDNPDRNSPNGTSYIDRFDETDPNWEIIK